MSDVEETAPQDPALADLAEAFPEAELESSLGQDVFTLSREQLAEFAADHFGSTRIDQVMLTIEWYRENMPAFKAA